MTEGPEGTVSRAHGAPLVRAIVRSSIKFRFLVLAIGAVLMLGGLVQLRHSPVDVFPEFAPPIVEVQTECNGLSSAEVEQVVTTPLEQALGGLAHLEVMRSSSIEQLSFIQMYFKRGTDVLAARELVQEKLNIVRPSLPMWAAPPNIIPPKSTTSRIMEIGIRSKSMSPIELSQLARERIQPRLLRVPGVALASIWGEKRRLLQVQSDPVRMAANGVTLQELSDAATNTLDNGVLRFQPAGSTGTGGFLETSSQRLQIDHSVQVVDPDQLAKTTVKVRNGKTVTIGDVADIVVGHDPLIGDAVINAEPGLMIVIDKFPWANTIKTTDAVDAALKELAPGLPDLQVDTTIFRPATFIHAAIHNLTNSIVLGSLLVMVVLALFLFEWRSALISIVTIPVTLMATLLVLTARHVTINTMLLAGLVIAIGAIVDDAIVDVENIVRRLRQGRLSGSRAPAWSIITEAAVEVRSAIVYACFIEITALAPVLFLSGVTGAFFRPLALSYALAVAVSLCVALLLTPALAATLLRRARLERHESPLARVLRAAYSRLLIRIVHRPWPAMALAVSIAVGGLAVVPFMGSSLFPTFKERDFFMLWIAPPGTSAAEEARTVTEAGREMLAIPGVTNFGSHIGRAIGGEEINGVNFAENWVHVDPNADYDQAFKQFSQVGQSYPGVFHEPLTYLRERTTEVIQGDPEAIVVRLFGPDLGVLRDKGAQIAAAVGTVPHTVDPHLELQADIPQITVRVDLAAAARYGLKPGDVRRNASFLIAGEEVGTAFRNDKKYDVYVWSVPRIRTDAASVQNLLLDTESGKQVRLGEVAQVAIGPAPNMVRHEGGFRRIDIGTNVSGHDLGSVARQIEAKVDAIQLPPGYHAEVLGEYHERQDAQRRLLTLGVIAALGVLWLLRVSFRNWRLAWLGFLTLPIALVGGELSAWRFSNATISIGSLVGFFAVLGIVARNGIMMITHFQHLEEHEGETFGPQLVVRGARERLAPILMTALATGLALVPLIVKGDVPGQEIEYPLALVILGGLVTSTLLNLFILPTLYLWFGRSRRQRANASIPPAEQAGPTPAF